MREGGKMFVSLDDNDICKMLAVRDAQLRLTREDPAYFENDPTIVLDQTIYDFLGRMPRWQAKAIVFSPPGRVSTIRRYKDGQKTKSIVYLELPKSKRRRGKKPFLLSLGVWSSHLAHHRRPKLLRHPELIARIGRVFS